MGIMDSAVFKRNVKRVLKELLEEGVIEITFDSNYSDESEYRSIQIRVDGEVVSSALISIEGR